MAYKVLYGRRSCANSDKALQQHIALSLTKRVDLLPGLPSKKAKIPVHLKKMTRKSVDEFGMPMRGSCCAVRDATIDYAQRLTMRTG